MNHYALSYAVKENWYLALVYNWTTLFGGIESWFLWSATNVSIAASRIEVDKATTLYYIIVCHPQFN